ncbi:hypothetical protein Q73A0000_09550 [Kaistella flava (ex Peng et al. 2021)]|uniref:Uncharacterized protein n=1 Tax=Kaistella flava (ex Peng et al. 2021) TaxID=2038776 RepID=A0A7M2Y939_9FLAO|nr:hypothetical protein [Kaistella flava (ex Peng et al. 2021)]QOW10600.1 hypothetical protein Q73A0000_09550 [Kaistella flava (ex Peng et al. 2021)]
MLVKKLYKNKAIFYGNDGEYCEENNKNVIKHTYSDFEGLIYYLCLTCFDLLGQSSKNHVSYMDWLSLKESELFFDKIGSSDLREISKKGLLEYNKRYGATKSFKYFINNILNEEEQQVLFKSLFMQAPTGEYIKFTDSEKINFLSKLRNNFTHNLITAGEPLEGFITGSNPMLEAVLRSTEITRKKFIYERKNKNWIAVVNWPNTLLEIIENQIKK